MYKNWRGFYILKLVVVTCTAWSRWVPLQIFELLDDSPGGHISVASRVFWSWMKKYEALSWHRRWEGAYYIQVQMCRGERSNWFLESKVSGDSGLVSDARERERESFKGLSLIMYLFHFAFWGVKWFDVVSLQQPNCSSLVSGLLFTSSLSFVHRFTPLEIHKRIVSLRRVKIAQHRFQQILLLRYKLHSPFLDVFTLC